MVDRWLLVYTFYTHKINTAVLLKLLSLSETYENFHFIENTNLHPIPHLPISKRYHTAGAETEQVMFPLLANHSR